MNVTEFRTVSVAALLTVILLATPPVRGADVNSADMKTLDSRADTSDALKAHLKGLKQYRANFTQTVSDSEGDVVHEAQGTLILARPNKLRWETHSPDETLLVADGEAVWNIDPFVEQVTILNQDKAVQDNPFMLLTSDDPSVWNQFSVHETAPDTFLVKPVDGEGQIRKLTLTFKQGKLSEVVMLDAQEQTSTLVFSQVTTDFPLEDTIFSVSLDDNYIVDDMR